MPKPTKSVPVAPPPTPGRLQEIEIAAIRPSTTNPRKTFNEDALSELTASIRAHGVLSPILVRPIQKQAANGRPLFEVVAGERRFRAAIAAGLTTIPANIRDLADGAVLELQVVENLQRDDLPPLEEAEGYRTLHETHGYAIADLAAKLGKSESYVYSRLALARLPARAKEMLSDGTMLLSVAMAVARMADPDRAATVVGLIEDETFDDRPCPLYQARNIIDAHGMHELKAATFSTDDADLLPAAGPCTTCPKRSINQPSLFAEEVTDDACTDFACWTKKTDAAWERQKAAAEVRGTTILEGEAARKIFQHGQVKESSGFVALDQTCFRDPQYRTYRKLLGKKVGETSLLRDDAGVVREIVRKDDVDEVLSAKFEWAKPRAGAEDNSDAQRRRALAERKAIVRLGLERIGSAATNYFEADPKTNAFWEFFARCVIGMSSANEIKDVKAVCEAAGLTREPESPASEFDLTDPAIARGIAFQLIAARGAAGATFNPTFGEHFIKCLEFFGINLKDLKKEAKSCDAKATKRRGARAKTAASAAAEAVEAEGEE